MKSKPYPLESPAPWALNQWYIAGFADELGQAIVRRTFLARRVTLFRDSAGVAHALSGICAQRMMPMEAGSVRDDWLVCGYHGLEFDLTGKCVAAPTASTTPDCALARYPLVEAGHLLWIWLGDPDWGAATPVPDETLFGIGAPGWRTDCVQSLDLKARSQLLIDKLFDLNHLGFVHASITGAAGWLWSNRRSRSGTGDLSSRAPMPMRRPTPTINSYHLGSAR